MREWTDRDARIFSIVATALGSGKIPCPLIPNVEAFGAIPDGITNCTPAFMRAAEVAREDWFLCIPVRTYSALKKQSIGLNLKRAPWVNK